MATESTEEHGNISYKIFILPCFFVDSVAKKSIYNKVKPVLDQPGIQNGGDQQQTQLQ
jgi:hypothetical protein